jgi:hypothetical protein
VNRFPPGAGVLSEPTREPNDPFLV